MSLPLAHSYITLSYKKYNTSRVIHKTAPHSWARNRFICTTAVGATERLQVCQATGGVRLVAICKNMVAPVWPVNWNWKPLVATHAEPSVGWINGSTWTSRLPDMPSGLSLL